jgi:hypothetical protein
VISSSSSNESLEVEAELPFLSSDEENPAGEESFEKGDELQNRYFIK